MNRIIDVKIIHLDGCGSTAATRKSVRKVANKLGLEIQLENILIQTQQDADCHRHIGSPTVHIDGQDLIPEVRQIEQFGLT